MKTGLILVWTEQGVRFATPDSTPEDLSDDPLDFKMTEELVSIPPQDCRSVFP